MNLVDRPPFWFAAATATACTSALCVAAGLLALAAVNIAVCAGCIAVGLRKGPR